MAQGNRSHGSDFDDVVIAVESEENRSVGTTAQGYSRRREPAYHDDRPYIYRDNSGKFTTAVFKKPSCFQDSTEVQLQDGRKVVMKNLRPGDLVQVVKSDGSLAYSRFLTMLHFEPDKKTTFLQICVEGKNGRIRLTPNHLIYANKKPQGSIGRPIFAKAVEEGMSIFLADEESGKLAPAKVREVKEMEATGFCAPLTKEGTIMADGVAASCYADFDHGISHTAFAPLRLLYGLKSALGIGGKEREMVKQGIHKYAEALMRANKYLFHVQPAM
ncbi:hypothetical protein Bbelb_366770 [Branchiostoma belcheri]|nr:hypothetical protein Bbelb_366770 [Branchiostoma belcheri]